MSGLAEAASYSGIRIYLRTVGDGNSARTTAEQSIQYRYGARSAAPIQRYGARSVVWQHAYGTHHGRYLRHRRRVRTGARRQGVRPRARRPRRRAPRGDGRRAAGQLQGVRVEVLPADLSDRAQVERVAERLERQDAPIDLLVNNAGFSVKALLTDKDVSAHDLGYEVMMRAVLVLGGAAGRAMRERGRGRIINVASTAAFVTMGSYSAIKAWVLSYSEGLVDRTRRHRRHGHRAVPGLGAHRVPRARGREHEQAACRHVAGCRTPRRGGPARQRARQGRVHTECSVQGDDVVGQGWTEVRGARGVGEAVVQSSQTDRSGRASRITSMSGRHDD